MTDAVVPGRFQPLHTGHAFLLAYAMKTYDEVSVGVATHAEEEPSDPLTYEERETIIMERYDVAVYRMEEPRDEAYIEDELGVLEPVTVVTANPATIAFVEELGFDTDQVNELADLAYSGARVRERACRGKPWHHLVPAESEEVLTAIGFEDRLRTLEE